MREATIRKEVINLGNLGHYITKIEDMFSNEGLNITEQQLVLQQILERLNMKIRQSQADQLVDKNPIIRMAKKFLPKESED